MTAKFEGDYNLLRQVREIDLILFDDSSFENKFKKESEEHTKEISSIKKRISEVENEISDLEEQIKQAEERIVECKKKKEKCDMSDPLDEEALSQELSIKLEEQSIRKYKDDLASKTESLKMLSEKEVSIKKAFEDFKNFVNENSSSSAAKMQELRDKRSKLLGQLGQEAALVYQNISSDESIHFPIASLKNGVCTNCNLENIVSMQVGIKSMEEIVACEYCGAILVDVISSDDNAEEELTDKEKNN